MPRQKMPMTINEKAERERLRQRFKKRKKGLHKKAIEITEMCEADVLLLVKSANGKLYKYSSGDMFELLAEFTRPDVKLLDLDKPAARGRGTIPEKFADESSEAYRMCRQRVVAHVTTTPASSAPQQQVTPTVTFTSHMAQLAALHQQLVATAGSQYQLPMHAQQLPISSLLVPQLPTLPQPQQSSEGESGMAVDAAAPTAPSEDEESDSEAAESEEEETEDNQTDAKMTTSLTPLITVVATPAPPATAAAPTAAPTAAAAAPAPTSMVPPAPLNMSLMQPPSSNPSQVVTPTAIGGGTRSSWGCSKLALPTTSVADVMSSAFDPRTPTTPSWPGVLVSSAIGLTTPSPFRSWNSPTIWGHH